MPTLLFDDRDHAVDGFLYRELARYSIQAIHIRYLLRHLFEINQAFEYRKNKRFFFIKLKCTECRIDSQTY